MNLLPIVLADLETILKALLPIVMLVIWVVSQVLGSKREPAAAGKGKPDRVAPPPPEEDKELRDEIEKFLREAADQRQPAPTAREREMDEGPTWDTADVQRRQQEQRQHQQHEQRRQKEMQQERQSEQRRRQPQQSKPRPQQPVRGEQPVRREQPRRARTPEAVAPAEVASDVVLAEAAHESLAPAQEHLTTASLGERFSHFGEDIERESTRMDKHIKAAFDHDLVTVDDYIAREYDVSSTSQLPTAAPAVAKLSLVETFRNPADVRQAIVMAEILRRPDFDTIW